MVNTDEQPRLDDVILQIFEEQDDRFHFPVTTQKEARAFVKALHGRGVAYVALCCAVAEQETSFTSWRKGLGRSGIGNRVIERINKPLQEMLLSDCDDDYDDGDGVNDDERAGRGGGGENGDELLRMEALGGMRELQGMNLRPEDSSPISDGSLSLDENSLHDDAVEGSTPKGFSEEVDAKNSRPIVNVSGGKSLVPAKHAMLTDSIEKSCEKADVSEVSEQKKQNGSNDVIQADQLNKPVMANTSARPDAKYIDKGTVESGKVAENVTEESESEARSKVLATGFADGLVAAGGLSVASDWIGESQETAEIKREKSLPLSSTVAEDLKTRVSNEQLSSDNKDCVEETSGRLSAAANVQGPQPALSIVSSSPVRTITEEPAFKTISTDTSIRPIPPIDTKKGINLVDLPASAVEKSKKSDASPAKIPSLEQINDPGKKALTDTNLELEEIKETKAASLTSGQKAKGDGRKIISAVGLTVFDNENKKAELNTENISSNRASQSAADTEFRATEKVIDTEMISADEIPLQVTVQNPSDKSDKSNKLLEAISYSMTTGSAVVTGPFSTKPDVQNLVTESDSVDSAAKVKDDKKGGDVTVKGNISTAENNKADVDKLKASLLINSQSEPDREWMDKKKPDPTTSAGLEADKVNLADKLKVQKIVAVQDKAGVKIDEKVKVESNPVKTNKSKLMSELETEFEEMLTEEKFNQAIANAESVEGAHFSMSTCDLGKSEYMYKSECELLEAKAKRPNSEDVDKTIAAGNSLTQILSSERGDISVNDVISESAKLTKKHAVGSADTIPSSFSDARVSKVSTITPEITLGNGSKTTNPEKKLQDVANFQPESTDAAAKPVKQRNGKTIENVPSGAALHSHNHAQTEIKSCLPDRPELKPDSQISVEADKQAFTRAASAMHDDANSSVSTANNAHRDSFADHSSSALLTDNTSSASSAYTKIASNVDSKISHDFLDDDLDPDSLNGTASTIDESYSSDLDVENSDLSTSDKDRIRRIRSAASRLSRGSAADGTGYVYAFTDSSNDSQRHRIKVGASRQPYKRLQQATLFNVDVKLVSAVHVGQRRRALEDILMRLQEYAIPDTNDWFVGPLDDVLQIMMEASGNYPSN